jgi:hypothetical protein
MRKLVIGAEQLTAPSITIEPTSKSRRVRLPITRNIELVMPLDAFDEWVGGLALEMGKATGDYDAIERDVRRREREAVA